MGLDSRIAGMFPQATAGQVFLANAQIAICDKLGITEDVLKSVGNSGINPTVIVGGRPLYETKNHSAKELKALGMSPRQIGEVQYHLKGFGLALPADAHDPVPVATKPPAPATDDGNKPPAILTETGDGQPIANDEPKYAGKPLSELEGLTDEQLLAIDGIGPKTVEAIREASKAKAAAAK